MSPSCCVLAGCRCPCRDAAVSEELIRGKRQPVCAHASRAPAAQGFALELYWCCPCSVCILACELNAFAFRWFKEKPCLLLFVVGWKLPSLGAVGAGECSPTLPIDVLCSGAGGDELGVGGRRCFFPVLKTSWFHSAGSLFFASKVQPTMMHLFENGGDC